MQILSDISYNLLVLNWAVLALRVDSRDNVSLEPFGTHRRADHKT